MAISMSCRSAWTPVTAAINRGDLVIDAIASPRGVGWAVPCVRADGPPGRFSWAPFHPAQVLAGGQLAGSGFHDPAEAQRIKEIGAAIGQ